MVLFCRAVRLSGLLHGQLQVMEDCQLTYTKGTPLGNVREGEIFQVLRHTEWPKIVHGATDSPLSLSSWATLCWTGPQTPWK